MLEVVLMELHLGCIRRVLIQNDLSSSHAMKWRVSGKVKCLLIVC